MKDHYTNTNSKNKSKFHIFWYTLCFTIFITQAHASIKLCTAVRGNGEAIVAHWPVLARIYEHFGPIDGTAGGSSGAVTTFLQESASINPVLTPCKNNHPGCAGQRGLELSLIFKSLFGYFAALNDTEEVIIIKKIMAHQQELNSNKPKIELTKEQKKMEAVKFLQMLETKVAEISRGLSIPFYGKKLVRKNILKLLVNKLGISKEEILILENSPTVSDMINPQAVDFIHTAFMKYHNTSRFLKSKERAQYKKILMFRIKEILDSIRLIGAFDAKNDKRLFVRPGVVNFDHITGILFGRIGNFYAGYGYTKEHSTRFKKFLTNCSKLARGKTWKQLAQAAPVKCHLAFTNLVKDYRAKLIKLELQAKKAHQAKITNPSKKDFYLSSGLLNLPEMPWRVNDEIGKSLPVLAITAVLDEKSGPKSNPARSVNAYEKAVEEYLSLSDLNTSYTFPNKKNKLHFEDIEYGYFGQPHHLEVVAQGLKKNYSKDLKSQKFKKLGPARWFEALRTSPAEPGLSTFKLMKAIPGIGTKRKIYSLGGWPDLHPVAVLKSLGCQKVVFISRIGGESLFGGGVVKRLAGINDRDWDWEKHLTANWTLPNERYQDQDGNFFAKGNWYNNFGRIPQYPPSLVDKLYNQRFNLYHLTTDPDFIQPPTVPYAINWEEEPYNESSAFRALWDADSVICTGWDYYAIQSKFDKLIDDAYFSPMYISDRKDKTINGTDNVTFFTDPQNSWQKNWKQKLKQFDNGRIYKADVEKYPGCVPLVEGVEIPQEQ